MKVSDNNVVELKQSPEKKIDPRRVRDFNSMSVLGNATKTKKSIEKGFVPGVYEPDEKSRWNKLLDGEITVADLDDEELKKMKIRNRMGEFGGRPPKQIPLWVHEEMRKEWLRRGQDAMDLALPKAVDALANICTTGADRDRLTAAQFLVERILGKMPEKVDLHTHSTDPWEDVLQDAIVSEAALKEDSANVG